MVKHFTSESLKKGQGEYEKRIRNQKLKFRGHKLYIVRYRSSIEMFLQTSAIAVLRNEKVVSLPINIE